MDLTITATVTVLVAKSDMDAVAERVAGFNTGWFGGVTFEPGADGPIWRLKVYREGSPPNLADLNGVIVAAPSFVSAYPSVGEYNSANPENQLPGGS